MAYQAIQGVYLPEVAMFGAYGSYLLDADGEKLAFVLPAPKTGNLAQVGFRTMIVTTGDTLKVSFQGVDEATGDPDGTPDQYRTTVIADGDDGTGS